MEKPLLVCIWRKYWNRTDIEIIEMHGEKEEKESTGWRRRN